MDEAEHPPISSLEEALLLLAEAQAEAARVKAINSDLEARNALLELQNAKMRRELFGQRSERSVRLVGQLEMGFEEAEMSASEDEALAEPHVRPRFGPLRASVPHSAGSPTIYRASASSFPLLQAARAVVRIGWSSSAKILPRRSK